MLIKAFSDRSHEAQAFLLMLPQLLGHVRLQEDGALAPAHSRLIHHELLLGAPGALEGAAGADGLLRYSAHLWGWSPSNDTAALHEIACICGVRLGVPSFPSFYPPCAITF